jgi:hypothetical protein
MKHLQRFDAPVVTPATDWSAAVTALVHEPHTIPSTRSRAVDAMAAARLLLWRGTGTRR